jgi:spore maturation protein CgeB
LTKNKNIQIFPSVSFKEMVELYSSFAISLGITDVRNTYLLKNPVLKLHLRTFEIPMSGGLQIINYTDEIASYFEDKKEIILYKSENELIDKTKFYLQDSQDSVRIKMKIAARRRAESDHTWTNRFIKIFEKLGL